MQPQWWDVHPGSRGGQGLQGGLGGAGEPAREVAGMLRG